MSDLQSQDYIRRSASTLTPPSVRRHEQEVAKLIDVTRCIGCKACQAACMEWNDLRTEIGHFEGSYDNPLDLDPGTWTMMRFTEWEDEKGNLEWLIRKDGCMHCEDPGCLKACPAPGAIVQYANGIVDFISENCIGCGYCLTGCPFNIPRISKVDHKSYKCTLCSDRVTVGLEPACVKACPTGAIMFGSKADMTSWAGERIVDLKAHGFANAGLYDPPGVGGTHVMYVLHHADRPSIYAGLPDAPRISLLVDAWKGILKPLALAGIAFTALAGFLHWVVAGPNEVQPEDEAEAQRLLRDAEEFKMTRPRGTLVRNTTAARINHWVTAGCFVLLLLSGLAMFHPMLFWLSELFGGGQWTRAVHPWIGTVLFLSYAGMIVQFWRDNPWNRDDVAWMRKIDRVLVNDEQRVPEVGRFNAGQKAVFWSMALLVPVLFLTGLVIWEVYFSAFTTIEQRRVAVLIHCLAAAAAIIIWIIHVYAAIWVRGSVRSMTQGYVTPGWAWRHHRKWLRQLAATGSAGPRPRAGGGGPGT